MQFVAQGSHKHSARIGQGHTAHVGEGPSGPVCVDRICVEEQEEEKQEEEEEEEEE